MNGQRCLSLLLALSGILLGCSKTATPPSAVAPGPAPAPAPAAAPGLTEAPAARTPIRIAYPTRDGVVPWGMVGQVFERTDLLARFGLDGTMVVVPDSPALAVAMVHLDADVGLITTGVMGVVLASERPYDLVAAPGGGGRIALVVPSGSPVRSIADLRGKRIENPVLGGLLERFLETAGLSNQDVTVDSPYHYEDGAREAWKSLFAGDKDALMHWDPYLEDQLSSGKVRILIEDPFHLEVMFSRPFIAAHREAAVAFMAALRHAMLFTLAYPDLVSQWYSEVSGVSLANTRFALTQAEYYKEANGKGLEAIELVPDKKKIQDLEGVAGAMGRFGIARRLAYQMLSRNVPGLRPEPKDRIEITGYFNWELARAAARVPAVPLDSLRIGGRDTSRIKEIVRQPFGVMKPQCFPDGTCVNMLPGQAPPPAREASPR